LSPVALWVNRTSIHSSVIQLGVQHLNFCLIETTSTILLQVFSDKLLVARLYDGVLAVARRSSTQRNSNVVAVDIDGMCFLQ
jgi:hypothetical protein